MSIVHNAKHAFYDMEDAVQCSANANYGGYIYEGLEQSFVSSPKNFYAIVASIIGPFTKKHHLQVFLRECSAPNQAGTSLHHYY